MTTVSIMDDERTAASVNLKNPKTQDKVGNDDAQAVVTGISAPHSKHQLTPQAKRSRRRRVRPQITTNPDPLLNAQEAALYLNVTEDWVWDHSSRRLPYLPVIPLSDGSLRYRKSGLDNFVVERERLSALRLKSRKRR